MASPMVNGYDKAGVEYTPRHPPRPFWFRVMSWLVFFASVGIGAGLGWLAK